LEQAGTRSRAGTEAETEIGLLEQCINDNRPEEFSFEGRKILEAE
jgi:hypothetical protein